MKSEKLPAECIRSFIFIVVSSLIFIPVSCSGESKKEKDAANDQNIDIQGDETAEIAKEVQDGQGEEETFIPLPFGSPCNEDSNCYENVCYNSYCTRQCNSYGMCPEEGFRCMESEDGRALCVRETYESGPGTTGESCAISGDSDCAEGYFCMQKGPDDPYAYCTKECTGDWDCPSGMLCKSPGGEERKYCMKRGFCDRCIIDDECGYAGDKCIEDDHGNKFCSQECDPEGETCPIDSTCTQMEDGSYQCLPDYEGHRCIGDGELCSPCESDSDCNPEGKCIEDYYTHFKFCGVPCDDPGCPAPNEYYCDTELNQCRPRKGSCTQPSGGGLICDNCEDFTDCYNGFCLNYPDDMHQVCGEDCSQTRRCDSVWEECYEITYGSTTIGYNCLPIPSIANCFQFSRCVEECPDGPDGCPLVFCHY